MTVLDLQIGAGADDGHWTSSGGTAFSNSGTFMTLGSGGFGSLLSLFIRFQAVSVLKSSTIDVAELTLRANNTISSDLGATIQADDTDNATAPANHSDANGRTKTTASVNWDPVPYTTAGVDYTAPSVASVVDEVTSRAGWSSGNALLFLITPHDLVQRHWVTREGSTAGAARLHLEITPPPNTAPTITVAPTVAYGSLTRTGPNNTPAVVTATAVDAEETGADELTAEIRTAASGGGTLVATDDVTSGSSFNVNIAHNASGINEGSNTLYLRVGDGTDWSDDESFTLLVDRTAPSVGAIGHNPDPVVN